MRRINQSSERKKERKTEKEKKKERKKERKQKYFFPFLFFSICICENELIIYLLKSYEENQPIF